MDNSLKIVLILTVFFIIFGCSCSCKKVEKFTESAQDSVSSVQIDSKNNNWYVEYDGKCNELKTFLNNKPYLKLCKESNCIGIDSKTHSWIGNSYEFCGETKYFGTENLFNEVVNNFELNHDQYIKLNDNQKSELLKVLDNENKVNKLIKKYYSIKEKEKITTKKTLGNLRPCYQNNDLCSEGTKCVKKPHQHIDDGTYDGWQSNHICYKKTGLKYPDYCNNEYKCAEGYKCVNLIDDQGKNGFTQCWEKENNENSPCHPEKGINCKNNLVCTEQIDKGYYLCQEKKNN